MPFSCTLVSNWLVCSKLALVGVLMRYHLFLLRGRLLLVFMGGQKSNFLMIIKWHWAAINHHENSVLLSFEVRYSLLDHFNFITYWILNELLKVLDIFSYSNWNSWNFPCKHSPLHTITWSQFLFTYFIFLLMECI